MAILTVYKPALTGTVVTFASAAGGGDSFPNTGKEYFHAKSGGTIVTITFDAPGACNFGLAANAAHDAAGATPATGDTVYGPFDPLKFNDANGRVQVTYSVVTTLTVAVIAAN